MRAEVARLRAYLADMRHQDEVQHTALLREANEQLVISALHASNVARDAVSELDELAKASQRDALTGTPNRALMLDRLGHAITLARRHEDRIAVLFVDIDHFKHINDTLGHAAGDLVVQAVAQRLESVVRHSDTVSRHSGDEFVVLLADVSQATYAASVATKMLRELATPCEVGEHTIQFTASAGIAMYPDDSDDPATLISRADAAMYHSKRAGPGNFRFYRDDLVDRLNDAPPVVDVLQLVMARHELALAEQEGRLKNLREANEQLLITALEWQANAELH